MSGKAVGGFPGLSFVFYNGKVKPQPKKLPRYLDLGRYAEKHGIPYTTSSNLFAALAVALGNLDIEKKTSTIACLSSRLREEILKNGLQILVPKEIATPAVFTIVIPQEISSKMVGDELARRGYLISYLSEYLLKRNWIQICLLGELRQEEILKLPSIIKDILNA